MRDNKENSNQNNFNGTTNFNGQTQVAARDIVNNFSSENHKEAKYTPEPLWRSPFTMAILTWVSFGIGILGVFPFSRILINILSFLKGNLQVVSKFSVQTYSIILLILVSLFALSSTLRRIAKKQIRVPLILNYAINGYGRRLTLEKIHIDKCPQCGGKMKYYNKPVEGKEKYYSDGKVKVEVTKKNPALECKRNNEHWYVVDPAEDKVK